MNNFSVIIGLVLSILGVLSYVVKLAVDYSRLKSELRELKNDLLQHKKELENRILVVENQIAEIKSNVRELYDFRLTTVQTLTDLTSSLKSLSEKMELQFKNLEEKIDKIGEKING